MKSIKGTIEYEIEYDEKGYSIRYEQSLESHIAAALVINNVAMNDIEYIKELLKTLNGKDEKNARSQLSKLSVTSSTVRIMAENLLRDKNKHDGE